MTDGLTMSPIELSWTAKKVLDLGSIRPTPGNLLANPPQNPQSFFTLSSDDGQFKLIIQF